MPTKPLIYLLVGHVTHDFDGDDEYRVGGTVSYAALMAMRLGWYPFIITAANSEFRPPGSLRKAGWHMIVSSATTCFQNVYRQSWREQYVRACAARIRPGDIAKLPFTATIVHLAPVAQDFDSNLIKYWSDTPVVVTPQGWMRRWGRNGRVAIADWHPAQLPRRPFITVLSRDDIVGYHDAIGREFARWTDVLVVTKAAGGCTVYQGEDSLHVPAIATRCVDPTGAGDIFAAAFVIRYWETRDAKDAAVFANAAASLSVQSSGLDAVPYRQAIVCQLERANPCFDTRPSGLSM